MTTCPTCNGTGEVPEGLKRYTRAQDRWRSPERVRDRHKYIVSLYADYSQHARYTLKDIALAVKALFGVGPTEKLMDHSTIIHHIRQHQARKCGCDQ